LPRTEAASQVANKGDPIWIK